MKNLKYFILTIAMIGLVGPGCQEFKFDANDLELGIDLDIVKTNFAISFIDATTERLIGEESDLTVLVSIHGQDADHVMDPSGILGKEYNSAGGSLSISVDPYNVVPSEDDPVKFTLVAELEGYLPTSQSIQAFTEGTFDYEIQLMEIVNPPEGVEVKQVENAGEVEEGEIKEDIEVKTEGDEVVIKVEQGTEIKDAEGNPLEGQLDVTLVHFSPTEEEAIESFPGGLTVSVESESGEQEDGNFITAGFVAIEITDENGNKAANFEQGELELDIEIDPEVVNPDTGETVQPGDQVPLWSYNEENGEWTFEDVVTVRATPEGKLRTTTQIHHLSWYNLDWFGFGACSSSRRLVFRSTEIGAIGRAAAFDIYMYRQVSSGYIFYKKITFRGVASGTYPTQWNQYLRLAWVPPWNFKSVIIPYDYCGNPLFQQPADQYLNLCEWQDYHIDITPIPLKDVFVEVYINCSDTGIRTKPSQSIYSRYRAKGSNCWNYRWVHNGEITITGVQENTTYELQAYYQNRWQPSAPYEKYIGTETNVVFEPVIICGE